MPRAAKTQKPDKNAIYIAWQAASADIDGVSYSVVSGERRRGSARGRLQGAHDRIPRRFIERATHLAADLTGQPDCDGTLLHTDLHFGNVLAGSREPWLAIDPKPMAGHPGWELQPVLRNRVAELGTGSTFRYLVRRRFEIVCDAAGIDEDAARAWTILNSVIQASWSSLAGEPEHVTLHLALAKALED